MFTPTFAADLRQMMAAWDALQEAARLGQPEASDEEIYQICRAAMNHALHIEGRAP